MIKLKSSKFTGKKSDFVKAIKYNMIVNLQKVENEIKSGAITYDLDVVLKELTELYE